MAKKIIKISYVRVKSNTLRECDIELYKALYHNKELYCEITEEDYEKRLDVPPFYLELCKDGWYVVTYFYSTRKAIKVDRVFTDDHGLNAVAFKDDKLSVNEKYKGLLNTKLWLDTKIWYISDDYILYTSSADIRISRLTDQTGYNSDETFIDVLERKLKEKDEFLKV